MSGKDDDEGTGGFPEDVLRQMRDGHDRFMREVERQTDALSRESSNIFVTFKDFVDTNVGSLFNSFRSLPDNIAELRRRMQEEQEARRHQELEMMRRWTHIEDHSPDYLAALMSSVEAHESTNALPIITGAFERARNINQHIRPAKIEQLYQDSWTPDPALSAHSTPMLSPAGASEYMSENGNNGYNMVATGNAAHWRWPANDFRWLSRDWFKMSRYSPVNVEEDCSDQVVRPNFKAAFEDLLCASLDKELLSTNERNLMPHSCCGVLWMIQLLNTGILPPPPHARHVIHGTHASGFFERASGLPFTADAQKLTKDLAFVTSALYYIPGPECFNPDGESRSFTRADFDEGKEDDENENEEQFDGDNDEENEEDDDKFLTELDIVDRLRALEAVQHKRMQQERLQQEAEALGIEHDLHEKDDATAPSSPRKVNVLSSLTTTTTTRTPDGTVTTRVILKQKFADGREETQEKEHIYHDSPKSRQAEPVEEKEAEPKKRGWFWT